MKLKHQPANPSITKPARIEPMAEGAIPLDIRGRRDWTSMDDSMLADITKKSMQENGISSKGELYATDPGLYGALRKRKLLDKMGFVGKHRDWASMSDGELVIHTKKLLQENGINQRSRLRRVDAGLYYILGKRKLLDDVGFEEKHRDWDSLSDNGLLSLARKFMNENMIFGRRELAEADPGLYDALSRRRLLEGVGFETKRRDNRDWISMNDGELISLARNIIQEKKISRKSDLQAADCGLYEKLRERKLLDAVFAPVESDKHREDVLQVVEAMGNFE